MPAILLEHLREYANANQEQAYDVTSCYFCLACQMMREKMDTLDVEWMVEGDYNIPGDMAIKSYVQVEDEKYSIPPTYAQFCIDVEGKEHGLFTGAQLVGIIDGLIESEKQ